MYDLEKIIKNELTIDEKNELLKTNFNEIELVKYLMKYGATFEKDNELYWAALTGDLNTIKEMNLTENNRQLLLYSVYYGHSDIVRFLLEEKNYDIDEKLLIDSATNGHLEVVELLLKHGTFSGNMALRKSASLGYVEIVKRLIEFGAKDDRALLNSADNGHFEIVKLLVENGASVNLIHEYLGEYPKQPLSVSCANGYLEMVIYLVEHGADVTLNYNDALIKSAQYGHLDIVKYLVNNDAPINYEEVVDDTVCRDYETPLEASVDNNYIEIVSYLIENGANNNNGSLNYATKHGNMKIVVLLMENGFRENNYAKNVALITACNGGFFDIVKYLVENGADINYSSIRRRIVSPLIEACIKGNIEIAKYLIDQKVDVNFYNDYAL